MGALPTACTGELHVLSVHICSDNFTPTLPLILAEHIDKDPSCCCGAALWINRVALPLRAKGEILMVPKRSHCF